MLDVSIDPQLCIRRRDGAALSGRTVALLVLIQEHGSLAAACAAGGLSYRHAWDLLRAGEAVFGEPLVIKARGRGSRLTALGERIAWAERRIRARLTPALDTLASEVGSEIRAVLSASSAQLRIHASHGFAVQTLNEFLVARGVPHAIKYCASGEALDALRSGACEVAGFPVPVGRFEGTVVDHYRPWLDPREQRVIFVVSRRQGLIVAAGNPKRIYGIDDLVRDDVRFINRQPRSGTRLLLDLELRDRGLAADRVNGYAQFEFTHAAVAAFVASGMADVGLGIEVPARRFGLEFVPVTTERYLLLCHRRNTDSPALRATIDVLTSDAYRAAVDHLPGYRTEGPGGIVLLGDVFPGLAGG